MLSRDNVTLGGYLRPGPAAVLFMLAVLLAISGPGPRRLEDRLYDWLQSTQTSRGSRQLILVDTTGLDRPPGGIWHAPAFATLIRALDSADVSIILPTQAPPEDSGLPDASRLADLADLEKRTRRAENLTTSNAAVDTSLDSFARQLAVIREQALQQSRLVQEVAAAGNVVVALRAGEQRTMPPEGDCGAASTPIRDTAAADGERRLPRGLAVPGASLCRAVLAAGHAEFLADDDGIVRQTDLLLRSGRQTYQAAALAALLASKAGLGETTGPAPPARIFNRFYATPDGEPAFDVVGAEQLIGQEIDADVLAGRIALIGEMAGHGMGYATPVSAELPPVVMVATALSNLIESDYVRRPNWLPWAEMALCAAIGFALLIAGLALAPMMTLMLGVCTAAALLGTEAFLLLGPTRLWANLAGIATFALAGSGVLALWKPRLAGRIRRDAQLETIFPGTLPARRDHDDLDLVFSVLRQQPATPGTKERLYEIAVEHARRRELAKAESVLRHLVSLDPEYRGVGDKLQRLAGMRTATPDVRAAATVTNSPNTGADPAMTVPASIRTLGRYVIERVIGRGAMATVYLGCDPTINRKVAVKAIALAQEFSESELASARAQFVREAESAGRLNHPGIIAIYDVGEEAEIAFLAMEYFPGRPLSDYAQQGRLLPARQVLELMARAAEALHYAHNQRVVHRDIKPANLLYDERNDTLKITDFGIARLTDTSRTKTGIILGTPSYMSPEQLAGLGVTGQSDLFSLGVTTYQLLAGRAPFRADSIPLLMQKIAHEPHEPLSRLRDDLPAAIDEFVDRALAKQPGDRFTNGQEMALALRQCCRTLMSAPVARSA
jgi:serine/threonine-protein kinase